MDKYEVISLLGEGSFGRVYKANQLNNLRIVALKVISKRGRLVKEIKGLRRECEIQRLLHHPNIIQMLDSFETDNEIVVITEFAHKELTAILSKEGYLSEEHVQPIVWDLVSALYYLHSHRVLHRDLKPQNILLDSNNKAKLCDFGFARNMSTGTHVLTSIKGTPLYMAPELIEEHPYDHNADLWSLGCIIYELLVGAPPFCTTSILHLIRMIRHEPIQFPTFISEGCISFLKGLLQKDPTKRVTWPEILQHRFVMDHVLILDDIPSKPLTRPMSTNTLQAKEQQLKNCLKQKSQSKSSSSTCVEVSNSHALLEHKAIAVLDAQCNQSEKSLEDNNINGKLKLLTIDNRTNNSFIPQDPKNNINEIFYESLSSNVNAINNDEILNLYENCAPLENEEWIVFLQKTIKEVMAGELTSIFQPSLGIIISPLRNSNANAKVIGLVARLLSLPFVITSVTKETLEEIKKVYLDVKIIANLIYGCKLLLKQEPNGASSGSALSSSVSTLEGSKNNFRRILDLTDEELLSLEYIFLLVCHLVYFDEQFLIQFCDSIAILSMYSILRDLLLTKRKIRIIVDLIAIFTYILKRLPENSEIVSKVLLPTNNNHKDEQINFVCYLRHSNLLLRERTCHFLQFLGKHIGKTLEVLWSNVTRDTLEALMYDSIEDIRNAAEAAVEELRKHAYYHKNSLNDE